MMGRIFLQFCSSSDIKSFEKRHYVRMMTADGRTQRSKHVGDPRGHHGQQIHYLIWLDMSGWKNIGVISGGSAVYATLPRDEFFHITKENREEVINGIIDNTLFRLEFNQKNLASRIVSIWRKQVAEDWRYLYDVTPYGFETFVEETENRVGSLYLADNWVMAGETSGSTKNHVGKGLNGSYRKNSDGQSMPFSRERVTKKLVLCKWITPFSSPQICHYKSSWKGEQPEEKILAKERMDKRKIAARESSRKASSLGIPVQEFEDSLWRNLYLKTCLGTIYNPQCMTPI